MNKHDLTNNFLSYYFDFISLQESVNPEVKSCAASQRDFVSKCKYIANYNFENNDFDTSSLDQKNNSKLISVMTKIKNNTVKFSDKNVMIFVETVSHAGNIIQYFIDVFSAHLLPVYYTTLDDIVESRNKSNEDYHSIIALLDFVIRKSKLLIIDNFNVDLLYNSERNSKIIENVIKMQYGRPTILISENKLNDFSDVFGKQTMDFIKSYSINTKLVTNNDIADGILEDL